MPPNIWSLDFLNDQPDIAYGAYRPQYGSNSFLDYWLRSQGDVRKGYEQRQGQTARAGQPPTLNWTDWLERYPWEQKYLALSPQERGGPSMSRFSPGLRWRV